MPKALTLLMYLAVMSPFAQAQAASSNGAQSEARLQQLSSELSTLSAKTQALELEITSLNNKLDTNKEILSNQLAMQDKRIGDLGLSTSQQANYMGAISNLSTIVGIGITVAFSLMSIITGVVVYFSARSKAVAEAQEAAKDWLATNSASLTRQIEELHSEAESLRKDVQDTQSNAQEAIEEILRNRTEVASHAAETRKELNAAAQEIMFSSTQSNDSTRLTNTKSIKIVRQASDELTRKPEVEFTSQDHFARGTSEYTEKRFESALLSFEKALFLLSTNISDVEDIAKTLFAIASTHGSMGARDEEIKFYNRIEKLYKDSNNPTVREYAAMALVNKGIRLEQANKLDEALATHETALARYSGDDHLPLRIQTLISRTSKAGITCLRGDPSQAISLCDEIDKEFSSLDEPSIKSKLSRNRNLRSFCNILLSKINWKNEEVRVNHLAVAIDELQSLLSSAYVEQAEVALGNLGYAQHLLGDHDNAYRHTLSCLQMGGAASLVMQKSDALRYRIEEQDVAYEKLLDGAWKYLNPQPVE